MDDSNRDHDDQPESNPLEQILSAFLGPEAAAEIARQMSEQGIDGSAFVSSMGAAGQPGIPLGQLQHLFNSTSGPVNWNMVQDIAKQTAYQGGDPSLSAAQAERVKQALTVADLWLDPVTDLSTHQPSRHAWTRVEWVEQTLPGWKGVCEPVAANVSRALSEAMRQEIGESEDHGLPPEIAQLSGSISSALPRMSGMMFGAQIGNALAALSQESFGSNDNGIPLGDPQATSLVLTNIEAFSEGLEIPADEVLQFLAVRECAHSRLFSAVPWLTADLLQAVQRYAQEIAIDTEAITDLARSVNPQDMQSLEEAMSGGIFAVESTEDQQRALARLETMLALIEGWVEVATSQAVAPYLPHADQLREMMRRRRVSGAPGEQMLAQLVGLQFRPRSARDAARLFQIVQGAEGASARDALWSHPDLVPTAEEIAAADTFLESRAAAKDKPDEIDAELEQLLSGTLGWAEGLGPDDDKPQP